MIRKFRKKPIEIEAIQWTGNNIKEIKEFVGKFRNIRNSMVSDELKIFTLEGEMTARLGDWIIKGIKGEFYPCKPDIFKETYEEVTV